MDDRHVHPLRADRRNNRGPYAGYALIADRNVASSGLLHPVELHNGWDDRGVRGRDTTAPSGKEWFDQADSGRRVHELRDDARLERTPADLSTRCASLRVAERVR